MIEHERSNHWFHVIDEREFGENVEDFSFTFDCHKNPQSLTVVRKSVAGDGSFVHQLIYQLSLGRNLVHKISSQLAGQFYIDEERNFFHSENVWFLFDEEGLCKRTL